MMPYSYTHLSKGGCDVGLGGIAHGCCRLACARALAAPRECGSSRESCKLASVGRDGHKADAAREAGNCQCMAGLGSMQLLGA